MSTLLNDDHVMVWEMCYMDSIYGTPIPLVVGDKWLNQLFINEYYYTMKELNRNSETKLHFETWLNLKAN